uniref:Uncharacterized protein n=1 Tax=Parastrongyloides trichosuri TaxID=131310 RepID=A0A0N4ZDR6_PARTI
MNHFFTAIVFFIINVIVTLESKASNGELIQNDFISVHENHNVGSLDKANEFFNVFHLHEGENVSARGKKKTGKKKIAGGQNPKKKVIKKATPKKGGQKKVTKKKTTKKQTTKKKTTKPVSKKLPLADLPPEDSISGDIC